VSLAQAMRFDRQRLSPLADWLAVGVAVSIPWSTTATSILLALWLVAVLPTLDIIAVRRAIAIPAGYLPVILWLLAALGMLWADVTWRERFGGLDGFDRLLAIPLLLAQFRCSERGAFVLYGFLASATSVLLVSWLSVLVPALGLHGKFYGVPVKDYILQSDEFLLCAFALLGVAGGIWRRHRRRAIALCALAVVFLANLAFVIMSRTNLGVLPVLVTALGWRLSRAKGVLLALLIAAVLAPMLWFASPHLRDFAGHGVLELRDYFARNEATSAGEHVEFLKQSLSIVKKAPVVGHGTGSIAEQFRNMAAGATGAAGVATDNPHNEIFAVAIQLGIIGAGLLIAMWFAHLALFRGGGWAAWVGIVIVLQNIVSSLAHSHLFDFTQGWLYIFGVGVTGGMALRRCDMGVTRISEDRTPDGTRRS
jgi:O-antigen ligase